MAINFTKTEEGIVMEVHSPTNLSSISFPGEYIADIQNDYRGSSPYHVGYCGHEQCKKGHTAGPFTRTSFLIHVVIKGKGTYKFDGKTFHIHENQLFLIYPETLTTYYADLKDPWEYAWVGCNGTRISWMLSYLGFSKDNPVLTVNNTKEIVECILRMMDAHKMTFSNELFRTSELVRFFGCILEALGIEDSDSHIYSRESYANVALRYLNDNYMHKIRISELADLIGVERSYLSRVFYGEYHQSPRQYLLRLRMEKSEELLRGTSMSVSEIAASTGYEDARSFTKAFRQHYGMSPSEYRKNNSVITFD
ncbi:MAG: AraC family transcriptional regulator [Lachnospiraceae bacterium]|nr:AraC family transcriptional regulator [Lachnospiraceae bacterium]